MKKLSLLIASIVVLLTVGIFTSQAVSNNAGSFNNLNFDFGRYVQDDVYKYKCDKTTYTCNKVKVSSLSTSTLSGLYDTESECKSNCKKVTGSSSYTEYTGGVNTDWWSDNDDDEEEATPGYSYTDTAIGNGLSGWDLSFGGDEDDNNNSNITQFSNPTSKLGFDLFDWGNKDKEDPITWTKTDTAINPFGNSVDPINGSIDPIKTEQSTNIFEKFLKTLGFDTSVETSEFSPMTEGTGEGDSFEFSVKPLVIKNKEKETITIKWDAEDNFTECSIPWTGIAGKWARATTIGTKGEKKITINYKDITFTEEGGKKQIKIKIKCENKDTSKTEEKIIQFYKPETGDEEPADTQIRFTATTPNKEGEKWKSTLEWEAKEYTKCESKKVEKVGGWPPKEVLTTGIQEVTFDEEGFYIFEMKCTKEDDTSDIQKLEVKIEEEKETLSIEDKWNISNNCKIEFEKDFSGDFFEEILGKDEDGKDVIKEYKTTVKFSCTGNEIKPGGDGYDVRDIKYGIYIDSKYSGGKKWIECSTEEGPEKFEGKNPKDTKSLTCELSVKDAKTVNGWIAQGWTVNPVAYVEYKTYEMDGFHHGEEHTTRLTLVGKNINSKFSTTDDGDKECSLNLQLFDPAEDNYLKFRDSEGGTVEMKIKSNGYKTRSLNVNEKPIVINSTEKDTYTYIAEPNKTNKNIVYEVKLTCKNDNNDFETKTQKFVVPAPSLEERCNANKCTFKTGLGGQVILYQKDGKITHSSDLAFEFGVTNKEKCELKETFQNTFGRVSVDNKGIEPDYTIDMDSKERKVSFENVWSLLPEKTQENIQNTFDQYVNADGVPVTFYVEVWSTFDEDAARASEEGKNLNCKWTGKLPKEVKFILDKSKEKDTNDSTNPEDGNSEGADGFEVTRNDILAACEKVNENSSPENIENLNNLISNFEGAGLDLDDLKSINEDVAQALSNFKGEFFNLSGLKSINKNVAQALSNFKRYYLALDGLTSINEDVAQALCPIKNKIFSNDNVEKTLEDICKDTPTGNTSSILEIKLVGNNIIKAGDSYEVKITKFNNIPEGSYCWWDNRSETNEEIGMSIKNNKMNVGQQETFDKSNNKYDNVSLICDVNGKEIKSNTIILKTVLTVKFTCIGCEQCKSFSAIPTWRKDRSKEKEIILSSNPKHYEVELPAGRVKDWTLRFLDCEPTPKIIKNDYNWKVFGGVNLQPPDIMGTFIKDISIGSKNLGTVEIEIKK